MASKSSCIMRRDVSILDGILHSLCSYGFSVAMSIWQTLQQQQTGYFIALFAPGHPCLCCLESFLVERKWRPSSRGVGPSPNLLSFRETLDTKVCSCFSFCLLHFPFCFLFFALYVPKFKMVLSLFGLSMWILIAMSFENYFCKGWGPFRRWGWRFMLFWNISFAKTKILLLEKFWWGLLET